MKTGIRFHTHHDAAYGENSVQETNMRRKCTIILRHTQDSVVCYLGYFEFCFIPYLQPAS